MKKLTRTFKMIDKLVRGEEIAIIRTFLKNCDVDTTAERKACDKLQNLLRECLDFAKDTIPPLRTLRKNFVYSVQMAEKPPFIVRTNDPAVIEKIHQLFIRLGDWQDAKFLLENLRLNDDSEREKKNGN